MASVLNINIDQGATFALTIQMADEQGNLIDVSQYAFTAMMRQNYNRDPIIEFTVETVDAQLSKIEMSLTPTQTASLKGGTYVWDIIGLLPNGDVARIAEGQAEVLEGVTDYTFSTSNKVIARSAYVGRVVGNQVALNGLPGSYYLDYNNFTNTPQSILDFNITDGANGQVLTTDGSGNFSWTENYSTDAQTFNGEPPSYYLSYNNLTDTPTQLQQFNVSGGTAGSVLTDDGTGQWSFQDLGALISSYSVTVDAATLGGQPATYYLDYNNLTNTPTMPSSLSDLGIVDGTAGQVLRTDGFGNHYFDNESTDAQTLTGFTASYLLDYNNFTNTPQSIFDLGVTDGASGYVLTTDGSGNVGFAPSTSSATSLNGQPAAYYLDYNNLTNTPVVPTHINQMTFDGLNGQVLKSDGSGGYYWDTLSVDADTLDGHDGTYYLNYNNLQNTPTVPQRLFDLIDVTDGQLGQFLMTYGNETVEFRDITLDGQNGSYYLDYNNFTNTPTIPSSIFDMADVHFTAATIGQVLTVDAAGVFKFEDLPTDAETLDGKTLAQIQNYTNLTNKPFIPYNFLDLLDMQDGNPGQVLTTNGNGVIRFADPQGGGGSAPGGNADTLNNQPGSYYLNWNNFTNVPTIASDVNQLTDISGLLIHPYIPSDVSEFTDTTGLLQHFSGDYNDLINKPVITNTYTTGLTFTSSNGNLTQTLNDGTTLTTNLDNRYLRSVNAVVGDANGNATLNLVGTETGTEAERAAFSATDGTIWVVSGDTDPNNDGKTYIYSSSDSTWHQIVGYDTAAMDARYVNQNVDSIDLLGDVDVTTNVASVGSALVWDGTNWVPGANLLYINDLLDVDTTTAAPQVSDTLRWDGVNWVPGQANDTFVNAQTFNIGTGVLTTTRNDGVSLYTDLDGRFAQSVNGIGIDTNGNVALGLMKTQVGTNAERLTTTPTEPTIWVISGDINGNLDGKTYVWNMDDSTWYEVAGYDTASMDARYVNHTDQYVLTVNGIAPDTAGNVALSISTTEVGTELERAAFTPAAEGTVWVVSGDADPNNDGKSYIWNAEDSTWYPLANADQAAMDARYLNVEVDGIDQLADVDTTTQPPADGSTLIWDSASSNWVPGTGQGSALETETFVATAGQTTFTLLHAPMGDVTFARNGMTLPDGSASSVSNVVTYDPTANSTSIIDAGDIITISYLWTTSLASGSVINDLIDVDTVTTAPAAGNALVWDSTSNQWVPGDPTLPVLEWDRVSDHISNMITITPGQLYDVLSVTLPSAGDYRLNFSVRTTSIGDWVRVSLDNTAGAIDGITWISNIEPDGNQDQTSGSIIYQATAAETITLRAFNGSGGNVSLIADVNGGHYLEYQKLSGFLPYTEKLAGGITDNTFSQVLTSPDGVLQVRGTVNGQIDAKAASGSWSASQMYAHTTGGGGSGITLQYPLGGAPNITNWTTVGIGNWPSHGGVNIIYMHNAVAQKMYRITMMIDRAYTANPISIEILV